MAESKKSTGQVAAEETEKRRARRKETNEKAAKAEAEGGSTPASAGPVGPVYAAENRQDRIEVVGHQYRDSADVQPDPGYRFDVEQAKDAATVVDHLAVAASTEGVYLQLNGETFFLDVELGLALYRNVNAASVALNN